MALESDSTTGVSEQEAEQGLREATGERRSLHLHSDEPPYGQEIGTLVRLFGQFQYGVLRSSALPARDTQAQLDHHTTE